MVSARTRQDLIYAAEYAAETTVLLTRAEGRLTAAHLAPHLSDPPPGGREANVCGGNRVRRARIASSGGRRATARPGSASTIPG